MPNFDGGHYFLTALAPIRDEPVAVGDRRYRSHVDQLRVALSRLPTARQNEVTRDARLNSPFARNRLNHLARFVIIDDPAYNGRESGNTLVERLRGVDPIIPQSVDRLRNAYLLFSADIDAAAPGDQGLRDYTDVLWSTMRDELTDVFQHCVGFDAVQNAGDFFGWIKRCQVETTMPFNDYWIDPLPAKAIPFRPMLGVLAAVVVASLAALLLQIFDVGGPPWGKLGLSGLVVSGLMVIGGYWFIVTRAQQPLPTAPDSDLPSVLKALYLQQQFTDFAISAQGLDAAELHRRFGDFVARHRPLDLNGPTQEPGVISSPRAEAGR